MGSHLGLWNISHGIPPGIMEHPTWDPTWDYGTSCMGSYMGSRLKFLIASHLGKYIPGGIKPRIPPIPLGILPQISDSFPPGKSLHLGSCQSQFRPCIKLQMASHFQKNPLRDPVYHWRPQIYEMYQIGYLKIKRIKFSR